MLNSLTLMDFLVLRKHFESKRYSPKNLGNLFILILLFQALFLFLEYFIGGYSNFPFKENVLKTHLVISSLIGVISIVFIIPKVNVRLQEIQFTLFILLSQNLFGVSLYLLGLLALTASMTIERNTIFNLIIITLLVGILVLVTSSIRIYFLLINGKFRKGTIKDQIRSKWEATSVSVASIVIPVGIAITFILRFLNENIDLKNIDILITSTSFICVFYLMIFFLPEQLVLLYCKYRFDSFKFERNGRLKPVRDEDGNIIMD
ncbi:hypothetical protein [Paraliobacillus ryukyuensis]|uniref:hypothetical protein n=1 Tax=Paraliobacillus ryukyuensis TaxID=200904 RepID=UPI0009A56271|nr:hypothetical protein [Paraliobacillus ryukyuensis]